MSKTVHVRPASEADSKNIFDWRNDPVTISTSRTKAGVEWADHSKWFPAQLSKPETACLIGEYEGGPCGVVWFRKGRANVYETSVNLAPKFRGQKLSTPLLRAAIEWMRGNGVSRFSTEIQDTNIASIKMFESCGFVYVHPSPGFGTYVTLSWPDESGGDVWVVSQFEISAIFFL